MAERAHPEHEGFKNKYFGLIRSPYRHHLFKRYNFCNQYIKNKTVADIPCGTGWGTSILKSYKNVIGIDISLEAIEYAKQRYENNRRKFIQGNMAALPLADSSVDVVLCLEGLEHVERDIGLVFIQEAKRVLIPNGLLILTCPVLNEKGKTTENPFHLHEYDEKDLIQILNNNYRIIKLERIIGPESPIYWVVLSNFKDERYKK